MNTEKLKEIIIYFVFKSSEHQLGRVKLTKLIYLSDVLAYQRLGRTITGLSYTRHKHGPWNFKIQEVIPQIPQIREVKTKTLRGEPFYKYAGIVSEYSIRHLKDEEYKIIEKINEHWGKISLDKILSEVYVSLPFKGTPYGEKIDFKKVVTERYSGLAKKHKVPILQAEWTEEKSFQQIKDYKKSQLSIKMTAKIQEMGQ